MINKGISILHRKFYLFTLHPPPPHHLPGNHIFSLNWTKYGIISKQYYGVEAGWAEMSSNSQSCHLPPLLRLYGSGSKSCVFLGNFIRHRYISSHFQALLRSWPSFGGSDACSGYGYCYMALENNYLFNWYRYLVISPLKMNKYDVKFNIFPTMLVFNRWSRSRWFKNAYRYLHVEVL